MLSPFTNGVTGGIGQIRVLLWEGPIQGISPVFNAVGAREHDSHHMEDL